MKSHIRLVFETTAGRDLTLNVPNADENVSNSTVSTAMQTIKEANAVEGVDEIVRAKSATLFRVTTQTFDIA